MVDEFILSVLAFLKSIVESTEFRTLVISLLALGGTWLITQRTRLKLKSDAEQKQAEAAAALDAKLQERVRQVELEKQEQINASIEVFRDLLLKDREQFQRDRAELQQQLATLETAVSEWRDKYARREQEIAGYISQQADDQKRIEALEADKRQRDEQIQALTERVATIETDRDGWKGLAEQRATELQQRAVELSERDEKITHQQSEIADLKDKLDKVQERLDALEKKQATTAHVVDPLKTDEVAPVEPVSESQAPGSAPEKE